MMSNPGVYEKVKAVFDRYGVPEFVWYPIALAESGLNALARGDNGASIGVFQLNRNGGQGTGYTVDQLSDPTMNAEIAAQSIVPAYNALKGSIPSGSLAAEVARRSGHPGGSLSAPLSATNSLVQRIQGLGQKFLSALALPITAPIQVSQQAGQAAGNAAQQATDSTVGALQPIGDAVSQFSTLVRIPGAPGILMGGIGLLLLVVVAVAMLKESKT
jgi:hypothetical protein